MLKGERRSIDGEQSNAAKTTPASNQTSNVTKHPAPKQKSTTITVRPFHANYLSSKPTASEHNYSVKREEMLLVREDTNVRESAPKSKHNVAPMIHETTKVKKKQLSTP